MIETGHFAWPSSQVVPDEFIVIRRQLQADHDLNRAVKLAKRGSVRKESNWGLVRI